VDLEVQVPNLKTIYIKDYLKMELPNSTVTNVIAEQSSIILPKTLSEDIITSLNDALAEEYTAHYFYRAASNWCNGVAYTKAGAFFASEAAAELEHAEKLQKYLVDWNCIPKLPSVKFSGDFKSLVDVINKAYTIEYQLGNKYMTWASQMLPKHLMTFNFLQGFVDLQNEAIAEFSDKLNAAQLVDVNSKLDLLHFEERYF
jgi:ferritin